MLGQINTGRNQGETERRSRPWDSRRRWWMAEVKVSGWHYANGGGIRASPRWLWEMGEQPVVPLAPRQPFWGLVVSYWGGRGRRSVDREVDGEREGKREWRRRRGEERTRHGIIPSHAPPPHPHPVPKKGRNKSIRRVRGICVIYWNKWPAFSFCGVWMRRVRLLNDRDRTLMEQSWIMNLNRTEIKAG